MLLSLLAAAVAPALQGPIEAQNEIKLTTGPAAHANDAFGERVALDGDRLAVSATGENGNSGAVYVYELTGGTWSLTQRIPPPVGYVGARFGRALGLKGDWLAVGAPYAPNTTFTTGAVVLYQFDGATWNQVDELIPSDAIAGDLFGERLSLSDDTLAVSCPFDDTSVSSSGSAYVFFRTGATWAQQAKLFASDAATGDRFSVALDLDGDQLAIGALNDDDVQQDSGSAYVFERVGGVWSETARVKAADPNSGQHFGSAVSLRGATLAVGADGDDYAGFNTGAAYVFTRNAGVWSQETKLTSPNALASDRYGFRVQLSGARLSVSSIGDSVLFNQAGACFLYESTGSGWAPLLKHTASDPAVDTWFGAATQLVGDRWVIGAWRYDGPASNTGAVYVYDLVETPVVYCIAKINSLGCTPAMAFSGTPSMTSTLPFDLSASNVLSDRVGLLLYGVSGRAQTPFSGGTLCVHGPVRRTPSQFSIGNGGCTGVYHFDFNTHAQAGVDTQLGAGVVVNSQYWSRDPQSTGGIGTTDAIEFKLLPR